MSDFNFERLSPDLILNAIESLDVYVTSGLLALNSYENRVYQFNTESHGRLVVKFYRPSRWCLEQIMEEHQFALELLAEELPVVAPLVINGTSLHSFDNYFFTLFPSVGGRQFEVDNLDQLEWMGRLIGRIHAVSSKTPFIHRREISVQDFISDPVDYLRSATLVPQHLHASFFTILEMVADLSKELFEKHYNENTKIRLHGDCHPGNILWRDGPTFVDLDDCRGGPAIQDLWMMLSGDEMQQKLQLDTLIEAYEEFFEFDNKELALIEPLRAMRMMHYMAWLSKRWLDPAFPRAFPWFGEDKYWENQILALKEQYSCLQQAPIRRLGP